MADMRELSPGFITELKTGFLKGLLQQVVDDKDLDLHIRKDYLNIYFKGNSLLKLTERASGVYRVEVHPKFLGDLTFPSISDEATATAFVTAIPRLKAAIVEHGASSLEVEYEQLIIRANNLESRINSDYFIVDRQYTHGAARFDLLGLCWPRQGRKSGQEISPCFFEIKYAQNPDIQNIHQQLQGYYDLIAQDPGAFAQQIEKLFRQKLDLGLFKQEQDRLEAMKTLQVAKDIKAFQFIIVLVDYNPFSELFKNAKAQLMALPFAGQIKIFQTGFGIWQQSLEQLSASPSV